MIAVIALGVGFFIGVFASVVVMVLVADHEEKKDGD